MKQKTQQIILVATTLLTILVNALANILPFNGVTTAQVSDAIKSYFTPAGYVFSIWGIIYALLLLFVFGYTKVKEKDRAYVSSIVPLYVVVSIMNAIWLLCWHYGYYVTSVVIMLTLLGCLIAIYRILLANPAKSLQEKWFIHVPFSVYLAWISVATIANVSGVLWLTHWNGFGISEPIWAAIMMTVAGSLAVFNMLKNKDLGFSLVIIWALLGIVVRFFPLPAITYTGLLVSTVVGIVSVFGLLKTSKA